MDDRRTTDEVQQRRRWRGPDADAIRLTDIGYVVPFLAVVGWVTWAYLRLRPPSSLTSTVPLLQNYGSWAYSHLAYSDLLTLYGVHHLANHALPYVHVAIEYPVLTGFYMWAAAWIPGIQGYFLTSCLGLLLCALGSFHLLYRLSPRYARIFAFSPLLLVYSLLNWDMLAILLMLGGWVLYRKKSYAWAGVLLSLGVCAKFFPIMALVYCVVALAGDRTGDGRRNAVRMTTYAVVTALVVNVPFAIARFGVWSDFFRFNAKRHGGDGIFYALHLDRSWSTGAVDALSAAVVLIVMIIVGRRVLKGASPAFAAAVAFATLMLVNKVFSPQYMLWVLVYALVAEWPVWTLAVITMAGLVDFANAMTTLHLVSTHNPGFGWYFHHIFPLDRLVVLGAILCGLAASVWKTYADRPSRRDEPGAGLNGATPALALVETRWADSPRS